MTRRSLIVAVLAGVLMPGAGAFVEASVVLNPVADSYADQSNAASNFGTAATLNLKNNTDAFDRKPYLRFDVTPITGSVTVASLKLAFSTALGGARTYQLYGLNNAAAGNNWIESGAGSITWNNAPANDAAGSFTLDATLLASVNLSSGATSVTFSDAQIASFLNADTDNAVSFMIFRTNNNATVDMMHSREASLSTNRPELTVEVIPEPHSLACAAVLMAGLVRRRRPC